MKRKVTKKKTSSKLQPFYLGRNYFIQTVTHYFVGQLIGIFPEELILQDCSWIADTGRFMQAMENGSLDEIEPIKCGNVTIGRGALISCIPWIHSLPRDQK